MSKIIFLQKSTRPGKKWTADVDGRKVHFGQKGAEDYTMHHDKERKQRYINRHKGKENWGKSGIKTAGFWSRWLLWNKPSIIGSKRDISSKFGVTIRMGKRKSKN